MDIRLARIDDRLIHGQVATVWSKQTEVSRILVVSDVVAQDALRTFLLQEAAPPDVKANVITIDKMVEVYRHQLFQGQKTMLLFTNPQDVVEVVQKGVEIPSVNVGGMSYQKGKQMLTNFISVDEPDITAFRYLAQQGIEIEIRKVPSDRAVSLIELLAKQSETNSYFQ